jgi:hypothetical protein
MIPDAVYEVRPAETGHRPGILLGGCCILRDNGVSISKDHFIKVSYF